MNSSDNGASQTRVPWTIRDMVYAILATLGIMALVLLGAVVFAIVAAILGVDIEALDFRLLVVITPVVQALMIVPAWWWSVRKYRVSWRALGLRRFPWIRGLAFMALGLLTILAINLGWAWVMERFELEGQPDLVPLFGEGLGGFLVAFIAAAIVAPVAEELLFRGFLYRGLRDRWGIIAGAVVSSVLFALFHLVPGVIPAIILMGLVFAALYELTDSVWPPILLHGVYNGLAIVMAYLNAGT